MYTRKWISIEFGKFVNSKVIKIKIAVLYNISKSEATKEVENNLLEMAKSVAKGLIMKGHSVPLLTRTIKCCLS